MMMDLRGATLGDVLGIPGAVTNSRNIHHEPKKPSETFYNGSGTRLQPLDSGRLSKIIYDQVQVKSPSTLIYNAPRSNNPFIM